METDLPYSGLLEYRMPVCIAPSSRFYPESLEAATLPMSAPRRWAFPQPFHWCNSKSGPPAPESLNAASESRDALPAAMPCQRLCAQGLSNNIVSTTLQITNKEAAKTPQMPLPSLHVRAMPTYMLCRIYQP